MIKAVEHYLDRVMAYANLKEIRAAAARAEMRDHLLQKVADLEMAGESREDAVFQAIREHGNPMAIGYGLRGGFPWLDVRMKGTARGVIAVGPKAVGIVAFGGMAVGLFSFGGLSIGLISFGGTAVAAALAWGMFAFAPIGIALGGVGVGAIAFGAVAVGMLSSGWLAIGVWVAGAEASRSLVSIQSAPPLVQKLMALGGSVSREAGLFWLTIYLTLAVIMGVLAAMQVRLRSRERRRLMHEDPGFCD